MTTTEMLWSHVLGAIRECVTSMEPAFLYAQPEPAPTGAVFQNSCRVSLEGGIDFLATLTVHDLAKQPLPPYDEGAVSYD